MRDLESRHVKFTAHSEAMHPGEVDHYISPCEEIVNLSRAFQIIYKKVLALVFDDDRFYCKVDTWSGEA